MAAGAVAGALGYWVTQLGCDLYVVSSIPDNTPQPPVPAHRPQALPLTAASAPAPRVAVRHLAALDKEPVLIAPAVGRQPVSKKLPGPAETAAHPLGAARMSLAPQAAPTLAASVSRLTAAKPARSSPARARVSSASQLDPSAVAAPDEPIDALVQEVASLAIGALQARDLEPGPEIDEEPAAVPDAPVRAAPAPVALRLPKRRATFENLSIRGALPKSIVKRGVERLRPDFSRCHALCVAESPCAADHWHADAVIDEAGRGRELHVQGAEGAQVSKCLSGAAGKLSMAAPDIGLVRVSWDVIFGGE